MHDLGIAELEGDGLEEVLLGGWCRRNRRRQSSCGVV